MREENKTDNAPRGPMTPEEALNLLPRTNPDALRYLQTVRLQGEAFENSTYGDYLAANGIIDRATTKSNGKSRRCILSEAASEWFDLHPEFDPHVQATKGVNLATSKASRPESIGTPTKVEETSPGNYSCPTIEGPVRCVLFDAEGTPTRFGIIRGHDETSYKVELPGENRTTSIIKEKIVTEANKDLPFWLVIPDTSAALAERPEFAAYLKERGINLESLVASDPSLNSSELPLPKILVKPFARDKTEIGEVVFLETDESFRCGIFLGLDEAKTRGALWMMPGETQSNVLIDPLEKKWKVICPSDAHLVLKGLMNEEQIEKLEQKASELKENPIDPFLPDPALEEEKKKEEEEQYPEGTIREVYLPNVDVPAEVETAPVDEKAAPKPEFKKPKAHSSRSGTSLTSKTERERLANEWIVGTLLPMIIKARETGVWLNLGSKGWNDMTSVHRVSMMYTGSPKRWYEALLTLTKIEKYSSIIGGEVTEKEVEAIKSQIEAARGKAISEKKKIYNDDAVREFNEKEIPELISQARATGDWVALTPAALGSSHRIKELIRSSMPHGSGAVIPFLSQEKFGLTKSEITKIEGKIEKEEAPKISDEKFKELLHQKFIPILEKCREDSDFRALEEEKLRQDPDFLEMVRYIGGKETYFHTFYRDSRIPLTTFEASLLDAREYTPTKREEILSNEVLPLLRECRQAGDFSPFQPSSFLINPRFQNVVEYLLQGRSLEIRRFLSHPRIGLSVDEIKRVFNETTEADIERIRKEKWEPLIAECRRTGDFSTITTGNLIKNYDLRALLTYYGFPRGKNAKAVLTQNLGVTEEEVLRIKPLTYSYRHTRELIIERLYPKVLSALESGDFSILEFDNLFGDREMLGVANSLLGKRPSVIKLLSHPEVELFEEDEARILVRANVSSSLRREREELRPKLIEKVKAKMAVMTHTFPENR